MFAERPLLWLSAILVLAACALAIWQEANPGYASYQQDFRKLVQERFGAEKASAAPAGLRQVWLEQLDRVDRCTSCHLGITWEGLEDAPHPFRKHPPQILEAHPAEEFGCTPCHGGQGYATRLPDAHGWVEHWEDPLLDPRLAEDYRLSDPWAFLEIKCNTCHRYERRTDGAEHINRGKQLIRDKGCRACHLINGRGGSIGPDLTAVGENQPEGYDYSRLTTLHTFFNWQVAHLQNPKSYSPDTVMPDFGFSTAEARDIGLVVMSWKDVELPVEYYPGGVVRDIPTEEELERERMMLEGEGKFFVEKTCFICHDVSSLGIESATKIGPDLALAVEDAPRRFGRTLEDFLSNPTGTMQVVLDKQIHLSDQERQEAVRLLKIAYEKYQEQQESEKQENEGQN